MIRQLFICCLAGGWLDRGRVGDTDALTVRTDVDEGLWVRQLILVVLGATLVVACSGPAGSSDVAIPSSSASESASTTVWPSTTPSPGAPPRQAVTTFQVAPSQELVSRWAITPADGEGGAPRAEFSYELTRGIGLEDALIVSNLGGIELELMLYPASQQVDDDGQLVLSGPDDIDSGIANWIQLPVAKVMLPPQNQVTVPFVLTVPEDAAPGLHSGAVVASATSSGDDDVKLERRTAARIFVSIPVPK